MIHGSMLSGFRSMLNRDSDVNAIAGVNGRFDSPVYHKNEANVISTASRLQMIAMTEFNSSMLNSTTISAFLASDIFWKMDCSQANSLMIRMPLSVSFIM